uniref:Uncharacterized protein n=1 Tax=Lepeophtheirus salmonis TaxID=72036 RepID=A0A0K2TWY3_LEPSM
MGGGSVKKEFKRIQTTNSKESYNGRDMFISLLVSKVVSPASQTRSTHFFDSSLDSLMGNPNISCMDP